MATEEKAASEKPANQKTSPAPEVEQARRPSPTATPERVAAARAANTAKPQPATTSSEHNIKLSEVSPKVAAAAKAGKTGKVESAKKPEAKKGVKQTSVKKPEVTKGVFIKDGETPNFKSLSSVEELVSAYNEMVLTATDLGIKKVTTVKTFVDQKTGVLACERLHAAIIKARNPETKETNVKKSKRNARKAVKGKTSAAAKAPRSKFDETAKISWTGKDNPFREGSGRHERTEKVRTASGQTVKTFLSKGGKSSTLGYCVKNKLAKVG